MFSHQSIYVDDLEYIAQLKLPWNQLKDTRILITGASGMIGTFLVDALLYKSNKENLNIAIVIGPEGGFEEKEIELLKQNNGKIITLGKRILRTETVAMAMASIIMYEFGELE